MAASTDEAVIQSLKLCAGPAGCMLVGGLASSLINVDESVMSAMQHLGGGVVIAAVSVELMPKLIHASEGWENTLAICVGFIIGVIAMLLLKALSGDEDGDGEETAPSAIDETSPLHSTGSSGLRRRSTLTDRITTGHRKSVVRKATEYKLDSYAEALRGYPWPMFIAVAVDSFMDGLLVGIAMIAGDKAGLMMAFALAIEMGFLGTVFAASLTRFSFNVQLASTVFMPAMILLGGVCGAAGAGMLAAHEPLFVCIISFGVAAMLYLVAEELLLEAHEEGKDHVWWVDMCFFVGVLGMLVLERAS